MKKKPDDFSFLDHLDELRSRLITSCLTVVITSCLFYSFYLDPFLNFLIKPVGSLVFTSPAGAFSARVHVSILGGVFLALPVIFYQVWQFVAIALKPQERTYLGIFVPASILFFFAGVCFGYFVMVPMATRFLLGFSSSNLVPMITVDNYISYVGTFVLGSGITFELPLVLLFLTKIGIATPAFLIHQRRYAIIAILIVSAVLTPPDVVSQLLMAVPLIILYEIGIIVSKMVYVSKEK